MTTYTQKQGKKSQKFNNSYKSNLALMKRQEKNQQKKLFQCSTKNDYMSKRMFIARWKGIFPKNVIDKKWAKMTGSTKAKSSLEDNPFRSMGSLFS